MADRMAELDAAQAREFAIAEILRIINASNGHLSPVFDAILENALLLCEAAFGFLRSTTGSASSPLHKGEYLTRWRATSKAVWINHERAMPIGASWPAKILSIAWIRKTKTRTAPGTHYAVPSWIWEVRDLRLLLRFARMPLFVAPITIYRKEVRPFSFQQVALLQSFAAQAVIAMENAACSRRSMLNRRVTRVPSAADCHGRCA